MIHHATADFWRAYRALPAAVRELADKNYELLKADPSHPSLHFKKVGRAWSVRVDRNYRALAAEHPEGFLWVWIGDHAEYNAILKRG